MMECRSRQDKTVDERYRDAYVDALRQGAQHAADLRTVKEQLIFNPRVSCGNHKWSAINRETYVANKALIENSIDELTIVNPAFGKTLQRCAVGLGEVHNCLA